LQAGKFIQSSEIADDNFTYGYPCYGGNGFRGFVKNYNYDGNFSLIGRQGALCGNLHYASGQFFVTEHAIVVEYFATTNPRWAFYFLYTMNLNQYSTATAQPGLSVKTISVVPIPLPPNAEQGRIVEAIEVVFKQLNSIAANLK
jgi:type I restriction enzyme S subunit